MGHGGDEAPIVGVAGDDEEGVHVVAVVLLAGAGGEGDVHQGFVLLHPLDHDVLHGQVGVVLQHFPGRGGVDIVEEDDAADFSGVLLVQVPQGGAEAVGVGVFAVDHHDDLFALLQEVIDAALDVAAHVGDPAVLGESVVVPLIQQGGKALVVVEDVALLGGDPVDVDLIGVVGPVGIVAVGGGLGARLGQAVGHDDEVPDVLPVEPQGEEGLAVVDPVGDDPIDLDDVLVEFDAGLFDEAHPVQLQLVDALHGDVLRHGQNGAMLKAHALVDILKISLDGRADQAEIADDPGVFFFVQPVINV